MGLLFGGMALAWMKAFPRPVLGLFLLLAGWSLAEASRAWKTRAGIWVSATMVAVNYAAGSLLGGLRRGLAGVVAGAPVANRRRTGMSKRSGC